ncbi:MAG: dTMP kinase [Candidatus Poribacteria bacterium]|nr:dTMP kinase [Candidatus Poribacteria bacterium]
MIYIELVGLDGAGKSRLAWSLKHHLGDRARVISVSMAEITYSVARRVVMRDAISPVTRAIAYMAAHSEVYDKIASDLDAIDYLIGDRGYGCFSAYQHHCPVEVIDALWSIAMRGIFPDLLVFVDTPVLLCQDRIARRRNPSALDKKPASWHEAVRDRYLTFCGSYDRGEVLILEGSRHSDILRDRVLKALEAIPLK